jgi:hypothetical protein
MLAVATNPDGSDAPNVDCSAIVVPLVTTGTVSAPRRTDATIAGNGYATNAHVTRARVFAMMSSAVVLKLSSVEVPDVSYVVASVNTPVALKLPADASAAKRMTGLAPTIVSIALATDLSVPNAYMPAGASDASTNGTAIVAPSTHVYPEVEIARATHVVGALMTSNDCCENSVAVRPSGAVTTTAKRTDLDAGTPLVSTANSAISTVCPDASYAYAPNVPYVAVVVVADESTQ